MRGFTLIELLVVLLIVAGLTAAAVPMLGAASPPLETEVREFATFLREARSDAIAGNREVVVTVSEDGAYGTGDAPRRHRFESRPPVGATAAKIEQVDEATAGFRFFPDGSSTGGEVRIGDADAFVVTVEWLTGRVRIAR